MALKVFFVGNPLAGDDGIAPYLFEQLKDDKRLANCELFEIGTVGVDLVSYVDDQDTIIIVDAVQAVENIGEVVLLEEKDLITSTPLSPHDLGVEHSLSLLRTFKPKLKNIVLIGIKADKVDVIHQGLSREMLNNLDTIKDVVVKNILQVKNNA